MSFAKDVKKEIANLKVDDECLKAELYGFLKLKRELVIRKNQFVCELKTNSLSIVRRLTSSIKKLYKVNVDVLEKNRVNLDYKNVYVISFSDHTKEILQDLTIIDEDYNYIEEINSSYDPESVIRGMFLAKGSVNDPKCSRYHLEIACNTFTEAAYIVKQLNEYGIIAKIIKRKDYQVVYVKKSEQIGDVLKVIGSSSLMFEFENERIKRDLNNVVNRIINCDIANSEKTQKSAMRQLEQIEYIEKTVGFESMPIRLMEVSTLRIKNPDASLQELSDVSLETIGRYISKSGLTHCFKDLDIFYQSIKLKETSK